MDYTQPASNALCDYFNEYAALLARIQTYRSGKGLPYNKASDNSFEIGDLQGALAVRKVRTVEERFFSAKSKQAVVENSGAAKDIRAESERTVRIDCIAKLVNECPDVTTFKRAVNEVQRILRGQSIAPLFPEPEFNPELLSL